MKSSYSPNYQVQSGNNTSIKPDFVPTNNHFHSQKEAIQASFRDAKYFLKLDDLNNNKSNISNNVGNQAHTLGPIVPSASFSETPIYNAAGDFQPAKHEKKHHGLFSFFKHKKKPVGMTYIFNGKLYPSSMIFPLQTPVVNALSAMPQEFYNEKEIDIQKYELALNHAQDDQAAKQVVCELLTHHKSLWDPVLQNENSFTNVLLSSLRHHSIEAYRAIVEEQYLKNWGVAFQKGEITLFRGDTRDYNIIFNEGFKLWPWENASGINKYMYTSDHGKVGVSLSRNPTIALGFGGYSGYYNVKLPVNHQLLLIPFKNDYELEVNSMDGIPRQYIQSFQQSHCQLFKAGSDVIKNPNFDENAIVVPTVRRGCY